MKGSEQKEHEQTVRTNLFILLFISVFPEVYHILQALALGLWHHLEDKESGQEADDAIEGIGKDVTKVVH